MIVVRNQPGQIVPYLEKPLTKIGLVEGLKVKDFEPQYLKKQQKIT
jgi:hypothetical protein